VTITFAETRQLAEEWTYRYLAASYSWAETERAVAAIDTSETAPPPDVALPSTAEVRAWARAAGIAVTDRGRLHPDIRQAWRDTHS